jgi:hypothetical protein
MSTFIRCIASTDIKATPTMTIRIVTGRRSAARISHIVAVLA